jgi:hypothetical protein
MRLATKRGKDSETGAHLDRDNETEVRGAKLVMPEMMRLRSAVIVDKVSENSVHGRNSVGGSALGLESLHILAAE